jgi:hypothetical protein
MYDVGKNINSFKTNTDNFLLLTAIYLKSDKHEIWTNIFEQFWAPQPQRTYRLATGNIP